jgi:hypothetical protein
MTGFEGEVVDRLARIETKLDNGISTKLSDHEERIRDLEIYKWKLMGGLALIQFLGLVLIKFLFK